MKKALALLTTILLVAFILGATACSSGGGGSQQPTTTLGTTSTQTLTSTQSTTGGGIGKTQQNNGMKVTLDSACNELYMTVYHYLVVQITVENVGTNKLEGIGLVVPVDGDMRDDESESWSGRTENESGLWVYTLYPKETGVYKGHFGYLTGSSNVHDVPTDKELTLRVLAGDSTGQISTVEYTIAKQNALPQCVQ